MSIPHPQFSSLSFRGLAICLVWMLSILASQNTAEATCGDYLMSPGGNHQTAVTLQQTSHLLESIAFPDIPLGCPNGECHSPNETPAPAGSTAEYRIVDDLCSIRWIHGANDRNQNSDGGLTRPADEPLPNSPFAAALERPPQTTLV